MNRPREAKPPKGIEKWTRFSRNSAKHDLPQEPTSSKTRPPSNPPPSSAPPHIHPTPPEIKNPPEISQTEPETEAQREFKHTWEMTEEEILSHHLQREIQNLQHQIDQAEGRIREIEARPNAKNKKTKEQTELEGHLAFWKKYLAELQQTGFRQSEIDARKRDYVKTLAKNYKSQDEKKRTTIQRLFLQWPEGSWQRTQLQKAQNSYEIYLKGRSTSFGNQTGCVDRSMEETRGYKIKCQNGDPLTSEDIREKTTTISKRTAMEKEAETVRTEIEMGVSEIERILSPLLPNTSPQGQNNPYPLREFFLHTSITIAHTKGKHPFLSKAGGMYSPDQRTISTGIRDFLKQPIPSLAHEWAHWLDDEAGRAKAIRVSTNLSNFRRRGKTITTSSMAEWSQQFNRSDEKHREKKEEHDLIRDAEKNMSHQREARKYFTPISKEDKEKLSDEKKTIKERITVHLGPYFHKPAEIWARLVEQYVSIKYQETGAIPVPFSVELDYTNLPAYWTKENFEPLIPTIESLIRLKLKILHQEILKVALPSPEINQTATV